MERSGSPYQFKPGRYASHGMLLERFPPTGEGRRVLDIGCAGGYLSAALAGRGYQVVAVDLPAEQRTGFPPEIELVEADLDQGLPELKGPFDFALCADILEHLKDPLALLRRLPALLGPGGRVVASLPNSGNLYFRWKVLCGEFPKTDRGLFDRTHLHFFTWDGWRNLFAAAGFSVETVASTGVPVGLALPRWEGRLPVRIAERLSYDLARFRKTLFAYQFVVTAVPRRP